MKSNKEKMTKQHKNEGIHAADSRSNYTHPHYQLTWHHHLGTVQRELGVRVGGQEDALLAGQIAGRLEQFHEGYVKVVAHNDAGHVLVQPQGVLLQLVHCPHVRRRVGLPDCEVFML